MRIARHLAAASLAVACLPAHSAFLLGDTPVESAHVDYRVGKLLPDAQQLALANSLGATRVNWNRFGTVHSMVRHGGYLATGYSGTEVEAARQFILDHRALFRLSPAAIGELQLVNDGITPGNPGHAVLFRQTFAGLPSANDGLITIGVVRGKIYYVSSSSVGDQPLPGPARLTPVQAWLRAAADVNRFVAPRNVSSVQDLTATRGWHLFDVQGFAQPQRARLAAMALPQGGVRQVWETVVLDVHGHTVMAYVHFVDAATGEILRRENRVNHQAGGGTTNNPFNGAMPDTAEGCVSHEFDVPAGMQTMSGTVAMANPTNDIFLNLYYHHPSNGRTQLPTSINDTGSSPESITYQPAGTAPAGTYELEICWYDDPTTPPLPPYEYAGNFAWTDADTPAAEPFPPQWSWFTSNPDLQYTGADVRTLGCWVEAGGCTYELANLAARAPWDVTVSSGKSTFTTIGNAAKTAESWGSPLTPSSNYAPTSNARNYSFPFQNIWNASKCDPSVLTPGGNDLDTAVTNLFVAHNRMHDWSYFLGFTERNYNMQVSNFGLTGTDRENDPEVGNVQAGALSGGYPNYLGRDNANQVTLQDGVPGITNQYLFQPIGGSFYAPCADGDLDMTIVGHEYTHAINNRMIGGPDAGIGGPHAGAMGESWGDLTGVEYQVEYGYAPEADPTAVGPYATGNAELGIRDYSLADNPLHLGNFGFDTPGAEVHSDGEIWNAVMWGVRQELVDKYDAQFPYDDAKRQKDCADGKYNPEACPGNRRWIALLFDAYLLMPTDPSFLDARDAMLAADMARFDGANQAEMWRGWAKFGMGENAYAADASDIFPIANFESPYETEASVKFVARAADESNALILNARIILGEHATRTRHLADTDPATLVDTTTPESAIATGNNSDVFKVPAGTYSFIVEAPGYGQQRFSTALPSGGSTVTVYLPSNRAALSRGSTVVTSATAAASIAAKDTLIDDSENTGARIKDTAPIAGAHATVKLNNGPFSIRQVNVSTAAGPDNPGRFSGVRKFEIRTCNGLCLNPVTDFDTIAYTSPDDAFPGDRPRPVQPQLNMRTFSFNPVIATHVQLRVLTSQCTGFAGFAGDQDNDPSAPPVDCTTYSSPVIGTTPLPTPPGSIVRLTELQAFGSPVAIEVETSASPVIDAGPAFTLDEGASATLAGIASDVDTPVLDISWAQVGGPAVTGFTGTDTLTPAFTAPQVTTDTPLTFELSVSDGIVTVTDTVVVTVNDLNGTGPGVPGVPGSVGGRIGNTKVGGFGPFGLLLLAGLAALRRRRPAGRTGNRILLALGLTATASVVASTPASHDVTAPTVAGQSVTVTWTGSVPPGSAAAAGFCEPVVSDGHGITLTIPANTYATVDLRAVFRVEWDETVPGSGVPDLALEVIEGASTSRGFADGGTPSESITIDNPSAGVFTGLACSFASTLPTSIRGSFTITAVSKDPNADTDGDGVKDPQDLCPSTPAGTTVDSAGCPTAASCVAGASATAAASTPLTGPITIDAPVLSDWKRLAPGQHYGAFVHFYRQGTRAQQDQVLATFGLKRTHDFRRYTTAVFAEGPVAAFRKLQQHPWIMRIEHNTPMRYLGDTQVWASRANIAREPVSGGPYYDANGDRITGKGVTLGVIDGGLFGAHPDFAGRLNHNFKFAGATYVDVGATDSENSGGGHGTHVTGTVAGGGQMSDGGYPVAAVAPLVPGTYTGASPEANLIHWGHGAAIVVLNAAFAYQHILDNLSTPGFANLRAVNNSYGAAGGTPYDGGSAASQLIRQIVGCGVTMVFAASNDGGDGSADLTSPTCKDPTPGVICVASYNDQGTGRLDGPLSTFSSRGKQGEPDKYPDIASPGDLITSTCVTGSPTQAICVGGDDGPAETDWQPWYGTISGTSMASPHVTGVIGLLTQAEPSLTPAQIELLLQRTARKVGGGYEADPQHPGSTIHFGYGAGLLDIQAALEDLIASGSNITKDGPLATDLEWTVFDGDSDVDASEGAADAVKLTMQNFNLGGLPGVMYRLTLADAADFTSPALAYRVQQNVRGLHTETTILADAAGVSIAEPGETNSAVATFVERNGNVVSFFVPYLQMGFPPINEPIHNIRVIVENDAGALDYAPSPAGSPAASAAVQPMFGRAFTTRLAPGTIPPSTERACELPGLTRVTSPGGVTGNGGATGQDDLRRIWVAEPGDMPGKLVITMKVGNLTPQPIDGHRWYVYFNTPARTDVEAQFVAMDTVAPGGSGVAPGFARGFRETIDNPAAPLGAFTIEGDLPGSGWNADGTITLVLDKAQFSLTTGMTITGIAGSIRQTSNPSNGAGLTVDSAAAIDGYTLVGNLPCPVGTAGPQALLLASTNSGVAPLVVDFDASGSTTPAVGGSITSYTFDFGDGTTPVVQTTPTVQHTYTTAGNYTATLTVRDSTNTASTNVAEQLIRVGKVSGPGNTVLGGALPAMSLLVLGLFAQRRRRR